MEIDYSKLLPALFNGKDLETLAFTQEFFNKFSDECFTGNSWGQTYLGFADNQEVRLHYVANRITIQFINGKPSKELIAKISKWLTEDNNPGLVSSVWEENGTDIIAQYYWKEDV